MKDDYPIDGRETEATNETAAARLAGMAHMMGPPDRRSEVARNAGRNLFVRAVDTMLAAVRRYLPPIHWLLVVVGAVALFIYAGLVSLTVRLKTPGEQLWPEVPAPCVIALWHRDAPSLLVAFTRRRPRSRSVIMISRDARGDTLALLCRMLGFAVVRGGTDGGWKALTNLSYELARGACVFITADGGGPARVAKVGAVALASAASAPLVTLAAGCSPAIQERHKWDAARNPIPFGSVWVSLGPSRTFAPFTDLLSIEQARNWLEQTLNDLADKQP